jgi:hypothetical protein
MFVERESFAAVQRRLFNAHLLRYPIDAGTTQRHQSSADPLSAAHLPTKIVDGIDGMGFF